MVTTVYLIRHAEAMGNINETFQGHTDCELSAKGRLQLEQLKERCREMDIECIFSSPLLRTRETADAVNFYHSLPIQVEDGLIEINGGVFEGQHWCDLPRLYPKAYDLWANDFANFQVENGESMEDVYNRITLTVTKLVACNHGKKIAMVTHGCAIRNFLSYANYSSLLQIQDIPWSDNTAVSKIEFDENLKPKIIYQNDASHLNLEMSTLAHQTWWKDEAVAVQ